MQKDGDFAESTMTLGKAFKRSIPVLVLPIIILGSIYGGIATPTEAAAIAAVYAAVCSLVMKDINIRSLPSILKGSMKTAGQLMILIATSISFAQAANVAGIPQLVSQLFSGFGAFQFLLLLNVLLLIVGCFFETSSAILILSPLLLPTAIALGINPIHLGMVFTVNLAIGMFTPPFGLNLFVVQGVLGKRMGEVSRAVVPFIILYFIACLIITYIPEISLFLPRLLLG
jgi:C4-dicarboxylate transporter DctM subunit